MTNEELEILKCMTARNCKELKELIVKNPDLPLLVFCSSECLGEEYAYYSMVLRSAEVKEMTLYDRPYKDSPQWLDRKDYEEAVRDDMEIDPDFELMDEDEIDRIVKESIADTPFVKAIVVHMGD